jgi:hypothetical protein
MRYVAKGCGLQVAHDYICNSLATIVFSFGNDFISGDLPSIMETQLV